MKRFNLHVLWVLILFPSYLYANNDLVVGTWLTEDETAHIRIFRATNSKYYGKIEVLLENPGKLDVHNPDESKRDQPLKGLMLLKAFTFDTDKNQWDSGTMIRSRFG